MGRCGFLRRHRRPNVPRLVGGRSQWLSSAGMVRAGTQHSGDPIFARAARIVGDRSPILGMSTRRGTMEHMPQDSNSATDPPLSQIRISCAASALDPNQACAVHQARSRPDCQISPATQASTAPGTTGIGRRGAANPPGHSVIPRGLPRTRGSADGSRSRNLCILGFQGMGTATATLRCSSGLRDHGNYSFAGWISELRRLRAWHHTRHSVRE